MNEYMTDEELLAIIADIEENDLVTAPPQMKEMVFDKLDKKKQVIEYRRYRNKVIAAVAAVVAIVVFSPNIEKMIPENTASPVKFERERVQVLSDLGKSHYISDFLNGNRED